MAGAEEILIIDGASGTVVDRCRGPEVPGLCPRSDVGEPVVCAGLQLLPAQAAGTSTLPYHVPAGMEICPVSWLLAMAGAADALLFDGRDVPAPSTVEVAEPEPVFA